MFDWFKKRKKRSDRMAEMEKSRANPREYTFGTFESTSDSITLGLDQINCFPESEEVFQDDLSGELRSICSFDLSFVHQDLKGIASFVHVFREYYEYPSDKWYNQYCTDYVLGFNQIGSTQLKLLGDAELFGCSDSYRVYKERSRSDYERAKEDYLTNGSTSLKVPMNLAVRQLGSKPFWVQSDETPRIEGIKFIGQLDCGMFVSDGPYLFLFIDPTTNVYYQIEQFT